MAVSQTEKDALLELKEQGYSFTQAMAFIGGQRFNKESTVTRDIQKKTEVADAPAESGVLATLKDVPSDIAEIGEGIKETFTKTKGTVVESAQQVAAEEISREAGAVRAGTATAVGVTRGIGEAIIGGIKLFTSPATEQKFAEVAQKAGSAAIEHIKEVSTEKREELANSENPNERRVAEQIDSLIARYDTDPNFKAYVDSAKDAGEVISELIGLKGTGKILDKGLDLAPKVGDVITTGVSKIDESVEALQGIELPSTAGIKQAVDLGLSPDDMMQRVARISKGKQTKFEQRANESVGSYLVSREIFGTPDQIVDQLWTRFNDSKGRLDAGLSQVTGDYKKPIFKEALDELEAREKAISVVGQTDPQAVRIGELVKKHSNEGLTLSEMNEVKRLYEANVKLDFMKEINTQGVAKSNKVSTGMREFIVDQAGKGGFSNVTTLNRETMLARQLVDDLGAEVAGGAGNNFFGLTDTIFMAEALGNPVAAVGFGVKKGLGSRQAQSAVAKLMSKGKPSQAELPSAQVIQPDPNKLSGYLQFLENQKPNVDAQ